MTCTRKSLLEHVASTRLAGAVATSTSNIREKASWFAAGDPRSTFGLKDWSEFSVSQIIACVEELTGADFGELQGHEGWLDPELAVRTIDRFASAFHDIVEGPRSKILFATGHPTGLIGHYQTLANFAASKGHEIVHPGDGVEVPFGDANHDVRFTGDVACVRASEQLAHTHHPDYMRAMLAAATDADRPDTVVADHGFAIEAWQNGIRTLAYTDVNDIGLLVVQKIDPDFPVIILDDNLLPSLLRPVTQYILEWRTPKEDG